MNEFIEMLAKAGYVERHWNPDAKMDQLEYMLSCGQFLFTHGGALIGHLDLE